MALQKFNVLTKLLLPAALYLMFIGFLCSTILHFVSFFPFQFCIFLFSFFLLPSSYHSCYWIDSW